jgi:hypothetical protein
MMWNFNIVMLWVLISVSEENAVYFFRGEEIREQMSSLTQK